MKPFSLNDAAAIWPEAPTWTYVGVDAGLPFEGTLRECLEALTGALPADLDRIFIELVDDERIFVGGEISSLIQVVI